MVKAVGDEKEKEKRDKDCRTPEMAAWGVRVGKGMLADGHTMAVLMFRCRDLDGSTTFP